MNVTVTLLNDRVVETVEELQLTLVEIENSEIAQGEYLLEDVIITIVDRNGIICIYMSCFNLKPYNTFEVSVYHVTSGVSFNKRHKWD